VIVVVMIITLMAAMIIPRIQGNARRQFKLTGDEVADLLLMFAQREALAQNPVGIFHDYADNSLRLMRLERDPQRFNDRAGQWVADPIVKPVKLPTQLLPPDNVNVLVDGQPEDITVYPLATEPGERRPSVEIRLQNNEGDSIRIMLDSFAVTPRIIQSGAAFVDVPQVIDLDAEGRTREDW
jgi:type II secretory pathway pseudopilin PulG